MPMNMKRIFFLGIPGDRLELENQCLGNPLAAAAGVVSVDDEVYVDKCRCNVDIAFLPGPQDAEVSWSVEAAAGVAADDILVTDDGFTVK